MSMVETPIFVIGSPRSGTTLLRLMLTCHPEIVIPPESGFALWLCDRFGNWDGDTGSELDSFLNQLYRTRKFETWGLEFDELSHFIQTAKPRTYARLVASVYRCYATLQGKPQAMWGDKNNYYLHHIDQLHALFPDAYFVHIVRDPRSIVCSYIELAQREMTSLYAPKLPRTVEKAIQVWVEDIHTILGSFERINWRRTVELRFEDLVNDPRSNLSRVCNLLGVTFEPAMLDYYKRNRDVELEPPEFMQWKERTLEPPQRDRISRFHEDLTAEQRMLVEENAISEMKRYGYQ